LVETATKTSGLDDSLFDSRAIAAIRVSKNLNRWPSIASISVFAADDLGSNPAHHVNWVGAERAVTPKPS
jgi:hypothetical protein